MEPRGNRYAHCVASRPQPRVRVGQAQEGILSLHPAYSYAPGHHDCFLPVMPVLQVCSRSTNASTFNHLASACARRTMTYPVCVVETDCAHHLEREAKKRIALLRCALMWKPSTCSFRCR